MILESRCELVSHFAPDPRGQAFVVGRQERLHGARVTRHEFAQRPLVDEAVVNLGGTSGRAGDEDPELIHIAPGFQVPGKPLNHGRADEAQRAGMKEDELIGDPAVVEVLKQFQAGRYDLIGGVLAQSGRPAAACFAYGRNGPVRDRAEVLFNTSRQQAGIGSSGQGTSPSGTRFQPTWSRAFPSVGERARGSVLIFSVAHHTMRSSSSKPRTARTGAR